MKETIFVTQPYLPPLEDFIPYLEEIWKNKILTNGGPLHLELEKQLANYLNVPFVVLFNNGTSALITAIQAFGFKKGKILTTAYSFVATAHSIIWNHLEPIFVDISEDSPNISPEEIESKITFDTVAILGVHCYGIPCDLEKIEKIAKKHNLKIIYDAAHAFGVNIGAQSVLSYGDISIVSFHATKVFNTFEGGAVICHDEKMKKKLIELKNFGIVDEHNVNEIALNSKMSEIHAAMGLLQLKSFNQVVIARKRVDEFYRNSLVDVQGIECLARGNVQQDNYAYFPIKVMNNFKVNRDELYELLKSKNIITRKYFHPLITEFNVYSDFNTETPNAKILSESVLCLPIYPNLDLKICNDIINLIKSFNE
ncbi:DegT/DnrJ/EryC1/StrS family aminotransferase [Acinetobacter wanghuae]|uniref:DegT/DnrJ/EryC1/StrS family aminotransferase n=1 Tax=Acinetobacter wanghuae TaxID=2662362 RepID=UPI003AF93C83